VKLLTLWTILCAAVTAIAQQRTIDLRSYGLQHPTNPDYRVRFFSSELAYLKDGTLIAAFPPVLNTFAKKRDSFDRQRRTLLHFDPQSGKLLHQMEVQAATGLPFMAATANGGFAVVQGRQILFYDKDCVENGALDVPLDVESIEFSPSGRTLALATASDSMLHVTIVDTATRTTVRQAEVPGRPVALLEDGYAVVKKYHGQSVQAGFRGVTPSGHEVSFITPQPRTFDVGFHFDCPLLFQTASDHSIAFAACGKLRIVSEDGKLSFRLALGNATMMQLRAASASPRLAFSTVRGGMGRTADELLATAAGFRIHVADLATHKLLLEVPVEPFPLIGGAFALSPDGRSLTVMTDSELKIYRVP
jgi:hypothetical protein